MGTPYGALSMVPAPMMFFWIDFVSRPRSLVLLRIPASTSVETTGLSTSITSGALPCWAASSALLPRSVVSYAVRLTVTPAFVPQSLTSLPHGEEASNCGYGSQKVYVPPDASVEPDPSSEPPEQAVREARVPTAASAARRVRRLGITG